ncbi:hypothetical protein [Roseovarius sp. D22-M7]|uniref:hypothetical protein n=1 Tax=Roseovarius sp. D22-M7 TaxID=3127116 RepID=UPI00300F9110
MLGNTGGKMQPAAVRVQIEGMRFSMLQPEPWPAFRVDLQRAVPGAQDRGQPARAPFPAQIHVKVS